MSKLEKGYGSDGIQAILGDIKTYFEGKLAKKANTSDLGTAAYKNSTNQVSSGSSALVESGAVKTALDGKISTSNTPGLVKNDGTIDTTSYEETGVAETLIKDTVGWTGKNQWSLSNSYTSTSHGDWVQTNTPFVLPAGQYTLSYTDASSNQNAEFYFMDASDNILVDSVITSNGARCSNTIILSADSAKLAICMYGDARTISDIQIESGSIATSYEPYHPTVDKAKADKVTNATSGNLAGLDSNGNLTDSGHSDADYVHKTGNEDITGNKHFTGDVIVDGNIIGKKGTIYGFHIDNTEDDPDEKITYMYDAVGMKPAKMNFTTGKFDYGSWENAFFMPRPCMLKFDGTVDYYLDPNDYSKKEDGTASDVADLTYGANAMMEWGRDGKKIWVKIEPTSNDKKSANILIADYQVDSDYKAWSFINNQGNLVDHFYTAIYKGSLDSNNRMRSISGQDYNNYVNNKTRQEEVVLAEANNPSTDKLWYTDLKCDRDLINFLTMLMFKSTDIQAKLGEGRTGFSWAQSNVATTGIMNDKGLFYGESSSTGLGCKLFGREQPYGDIWMAEAGFLNVNGTPKTKLTYGTQDGSTANGYNFDGTGYTAIDVTLSSASANYISEMIYDSSYGMVPVAIGGNEHIDYCDTLWTNNSQTNYALRGGALHHGRRCGAFCLDLRNVAGSRSGTVGAALSCKPLA